MDHLHRQDPFPWVILHIAVAVLVILYVVRFVHWPSPQTVQASDINSDFSNIYKETCAAGSICRTMMSPPNGLNCYAQDETRVAPLAIQYAKNAITITGGQPGDHVVYTCLDDTGTVEINGTNALSY